MADDHVDTRRLLGLVEETGIGLNDLIDLWVKETGSQLTVVAEALASGNLGDATRVVHGAASATALYGLTDLAGGLSGIEALLKTGDAAAARPALEQARLEFARVSAALEKVRQ